MLFKEEELTMKKAFLLSIIAVPLLFTGCLEYSEEIWFKNDMSGTIKMDIVIEQKLVDLTKEAKREDNIFSLKGIQNRFGALEGITLVDATIDTAGDNRHTSITLDFDSLESLNKISNTGKKTDFLGSIEVIMTDSLVTYTRTVVMSDDAKNTMIDKYMEQFIWSYTVHFPNKVLEVNRTVSSFDTSNNTATWEYTLADLMKNSRTMKAVFAAPSPRDYVAMAAGGLLFLVFVTVLYKYVGGMR